MFSEPYYIHKPNDYIGFFEKIVFLIVQKKKFKVKYYNVRY